MNQTNTLERVAPLRIYRPEPVSAPRVEVRGKHLFAGTERLHVRGVTYGAFRPNDRKVEFHDHGKIDRDFEMMAASGMNAVRIPHTMPPVELLDIAARRGLRVMVGLSAEQYVGYLIDGRDVGEIEEEVRAKVRNVAGHPALLCYALGNELPAGLVRFLGARRVESYLRRMYDAVKLEDPTALVTYVNYPTTEYLQLPFLDLVSFNVYLEEESRLESYLHRLHNIAGDRPLLMSEVGLDSLRNGEDAQAQVLNWQIRTAFRVGCAGTFVFSWTDEWFRGGEDVDDWEFGLTTRDRQPKPALHAVSRAYADVPFAAAREWPRISVVVCTYNGGRTLRSCLRGLGRLRYPNHELIVVDDGSSDDTAAIAAEFDVRLISTPNQGLSAARNTGLHAATGEIVAYTDDDAYPDPDWLYYLADAFDRTSHVAVGGPNLPPPGDSLVAECVANAPGGPVHVLLTDTIAEHIPGCNMAFRKSALLAIGGFDPQFRVAGDDVDLCWRLQERGWTIGFSPAAVVWHHRRSSLGGYWKQQRGYARAEALLERKWPEKYNRVGHVTWGGRVYGAGLARAAFLSRGRIYQGIWGSAPFQSLYAPASGLLDSILLMPEFYLIVLTLVTLSGLGVFWPPLLAAVPFALAAIGAVVFQAVRAAAEARFPAPAMTRLEKGKRLLLITLLNLLQPAARLRGRIIHGLTPWRRGRWAMAESHPWVFPRSFAHNIWSELWAPPNDWLERVEEELKASGCAVRRGGDYDNWDLELTSGSLGGARLLLAAEDHAGGRQYVRIKGWPVIPVQQATISVLLIILMIAAAAGGAGLVATVFGALAVLIVGLMTAEAGAATATVRNVLAEIEAAALEANRGRAPAPATSESAVLEPTGSPA